MSKEPQVIQPAGLITEGGGEVVALTPMGLLQIATEKGADVETLERLMNLQDRYEATEAKKAYVAAMMDFQEDCPLIDKLSDGHKIKYANLADTLKQIKPLMKANGFTHSWKTEQADSGLLTVVCCVTHAKGHQECSSMTAAADTSGSKNDVQAIGSTNTYLQRYTLFSVLGLASTDQDDDAKGAAPVKAAAPKGTSDQFENKDGTVAISNLKKAVRDLGNDVLACSDQDELTALLNSGDSIEIMALTEKHMVDWWHGNGAELHGLNGEINAKRAELSEGE